jgi:transposase
MLKARGIECLVIDPGSLQVNRRGRRVKTDRVDVKMLLRTLIAWCRGERHVWSPVRIPSVEEEDLRRSHRERSRLVRERTAHINRIKGLLFGQGIRDVNVKSQYKTLAVDKLLTADGHRLPPRLAERKRQLLLQLKALGRRSQPCFRVRSITANSPTGGRWEASWVLPQAPTAAARRSAARGFREQAVAKCVPL